VDGPDKIGTQPVAFYAAVFFHVNATYISLCWELIYRTPSGRAVKCARDDARQIDRDTVPFGMAMAVALKNPPLGLGICCYCLIFYLRLGRSGAESVQ